MSKRRLLDLLEQAKHHLAVMERLVQQAELPVAYGRGAKRKTKCVDTGQEYDSMSEAAQAEGVTPGWMSCAIRNGYRVNGRTYDYS